MNPLTRVMIAGSVAATTTAGAVHAQDRTEINLLMPTPMSANFPPLIAASALDYFADEGLELNLLPSSTTIPYVAFLQNGQADVAFLDPAQTFQALEAGADIEIVFAVMPRAAEGIAVSDQSDYRDVADLAGTTVGLVSDRDRATLGMALDARDLSLDDVTPVVVGEAGPTLANAFRKQTVSAIAGSDLDWLSIQASGIGIRIITPEEVSRTPSNSAAVSSTRIDEMQDPLTGFFRAWAKGVHATTVDPEVMSEMARTAVPEEWENEEFGQQLLTASVKLTQSATEQTGMPEADIWSEIQPAIIEQGVMSEEIDPATFTDDRFIGPANDFSAEEVESDVAEWRAANM